MSTPAAPARDVFAWISEIDAASLLAVAAGRLASVEDAAAAARAILAVRAAAEAPGAERPADYLDIQPRLRAQAGTAADAIHIGRSRQDILATVHRLLLRDRLCDVSAALLEVRRALVARAQEDLHTLVPAYTNGVQAQPTTFGHLALGYDEALARASQRLAQAYARVNRSPLGAAALATTAHGVDRGRLAALLGFDGPEENAFDAAQLAPVDIGFDAASAAMGLALTVSTWVQDVFAQYHHARPWIVLTAPELLTPSTLMPQKRNPVALGRVRLLAGEVLGDGMRAALTGHNVPSGVTDYKRYDAAETLDRAARMLAELLGVLSGLRVDAEAALAELGAEFATASHAAYVIEQEAQVPAAQAHAVVSALVDDARGRGVGSSGVGADDVGRAFEAVTGSPWRGDAERVRTAFQPGAMVAAARGTGGPQPRELDRMLRVAEDRIETDSALLRRAVERLRTVDAQRERALRALAGT